MVIGIVMVIGGGTWYYFSRTEHTRISEIIGNPRAFDGKEVAIEGEVTDRTSFFITVKFYRVKDKTGEITIVTRRTLPEVRSTVRVIGMIDEAFSIGDQKLTIIVEKSVEEKVRDK